MVISILILNAISSFVVIKYKVYLSEFRGFYNPIIIFVTSRKCSQSIWKGDLFPFRQFWGRLLNFLVFGGDSPLQLLYVFGRRHLFRTNAALSQHIPNALIVLHVLFRNSGAQDADGA